MSLALRTGTAVVGEAGPYALDSEVIQFYRDLLEPYGGVVDEKLARPGRNVPFVDLAEQTMRAVSDPLPAPDLLVLAYALPDLHPLKTVSSHLNHLFGGRSRSFAISEQGLSAPFTALRVADAYARSGRCTSLALFVLEQTTFAYPEPFAHTHDLVDSGVLMFFDDAGEWAVSAVHTAISGDDLGAVLRTAVAPDDTLLVAGPWTDPAVLAATGLPCHRAEPGSYCTSVWRELSQHHEEWARRYRTVALCDTDVRLGPTHLAVLTRVAVPPPNPPRRRELP